MKDFNLYNIDACEKERKILFELKSPKKYAIFLSIHTNK